VDVVAPPCYILRIADARLRGERRKQLRAGIEPAMIGHGLFGARRQSIG
jgi:hypothetical protein